MDYKDCLIPDNIEYHIDIKKGYYECDKAIELADDFVGEIYKMCDEYIAKYNPKPNEEVADKILKIQTDIIRNTLKRELIR